MNRTRLTTVLAPFAALMLVLAACGTTASPSTDASASATQAAPSDSQAEPSDSEAAASEERVRIDGSQFDPSELTVAVGTKVVFTNADGFAHTVTEGTDGQAVADPIVDEEIEQNGSVSVTFDEAGTYDITCKIHSSMHMTITVEG